MHNLNDRLDKDGLLLKSFFTDLSIYIKSLQLKTGAIPSNADGTHDPWDHIESIMGLNFANEIQPSKLAFRWLINNQNNDGSWFSKYNDLKPLEKNKPTHFGPYISVAALHFHKIFNDIKFLQELWPTIVQAINFSVNLQTPNGTIPWSIDKNGNIEEDYLLTGSASILKSIECALALSNILNDQTNIKNWKNSYESLSDAIKNPDNKFDLLKDRKNFSMDWYYPILSGCLDTDQIDYYVNEVFKNFYKSGLGIKCVKEEPWITVAETSEFIISLVIAGRKNDAISLLNDVIKISDKNHIPFMGWQYKEKIFWPIEQPSWTAAALILSADSIFNYSKGSDIFLVNNSILY